MPRPLLWGQPIVVARCVKAPGDVIFRSFFLFCILIGEDDKVGKVDVSISVEVKVTLIAGVAPVQAKVLDE